MALGIGMVSIRSDKKSSDDSFGLVALCSIGPILSVLILSICFEPSATTTETVIRDIVDTRDAVERSIRFLSGEGEMWEHKAEEEEN